MRLSRRKLLLMAANGAALAVLAGTQGRKIEEAMRRLVDGAGKHLGQGGALLGTGGGALTEVASGAALEYYQIPAAVRFQGTYNRTYISWIDYTGKVQMRYYDHDTLGFGPITTVHDLASVDDHNAPTLLILADGTILIFFCDHRAYDVFLMKRSTNPEDITAWGAAVDMTDTVAATAYNYPEPRLLDNGNILLFYRRGGAESSIWAYKVSDDDGATWGAATTLLGTVANGSYMYSYAHGNEVHVATHYLYVDGGTRYRVAAGYFYSPDGGTTWQKRDGTPLSLPITDATADEVFDSGLLQGRTLDLFVDADGEPYIVFCYKLDPDHEYRFARYTGGAWVTYQITTTALLKGGAFYFYSGGAAIDHDNPYKVYIAKRRTKLEIEAWVSGDNGVTWALHEAITSDSAADNWRPQVVQNYAERFRLVWCNGAYIDELTYDQVDLQSEPTKHGIP